MTIDSEILALSPAYFWPCDETTGNTLTDSVAGAVLTVNDTLTGAETATVDASTETYSGGFSIPVQSVDATNVASVAPILYGGDSEISFDVLDPASGAFTILTYIKHPGFLNAALPYGTLAFQKFSDVANAGIIIKVDGSSASYVGNLIQVEVMQGVSGKTSMIFPFVGTDSGEGIWLIITGNANNIASSLRLYAGGIPLTAIPGYTTVGTTFVDPGVIDSIVINNASDTNSVWDLSTQTSDNTFTFSKLALFNREFTYTDVLSLCSNTLHIHPYDAAVYSLNPTYYNKMHDANHSCIPQIGEGVLISSTASIDPVTITLGPNVDKKGQQLTAAGISSMLANTTVNDLDILSFGKPWTIGFIIEPITYPDFGSYTSDIFLQFGSSTAGSDDAGIRFHMDQNTGGSTPETIGVETVMGPSTTLGQSGVKFYPASPYSAMHIIAAYNGDNNYLTDTNLKFYINGSLVASDSSWNNAVANTSTAALCDVLQVNCWRPTTVNDSDPEFKIRNVFVVPSQITATQASNLYKEAVSEDALFNISDTANLASSTEIVHSYINFIIDEIADAETQVLSKGTFGNTISESLVLTDALKLAYTKIISETVSLTDSSILKANILQTIAEFIATTSVATSKARFKNALLDTIDIIAALSDGLVFPIRESIDLQDLVSETLKVVEQLMDVIAASDGSTPLFRLAAFVNESVDFDDVLTNKQVFKFLVQDQIVIFGGLKETGENYTFVLNTESKGVSEYSNYNFNSMSNGYAATDTAIYKLTGSDDAGTQINASIKTALLDFGSSMQKQIPWAYLGLSSDGGMYLKTITDYRGERVETWYLVSQTSDATDTIRAKLGKGVKSRYWQFELTNVDGADFSLESMEVLPLTLRRRV